MIRVFQRRSALVIAMSGLASIAIMWLIFHGPDHRTLRIVQGFTDPAVDETRPLGELFTGNAHFSEAVWTPFWSNDDHLVAVEVRLTSLDEMKLAHPAWLQSVVKQCALNPAWAGIAYDQPATLLISFKVAVNATGEMTVETTSLRFLELWIDYKASAVDAYEDSIEKAIASVDDVGQAKKYRLRHAGERALFNAGLSNPMIAGAGLDLAAPATLAALVHWH